jgi:hypothetical protein
MGFVQCGERLRRRQAGEPFAETLDAPTFLIHRHHQPIVGSLADLAHQFTQLLRIMEVAGEQDKSADQRVF